MNTRVRLLIFGILILGICIIGYAFLRPGDNTLPNDQANNANKNQGDQDDNESLQADPEYVMVGGVRRPRAELSLGDEDKEKINRLNEQKDKRESDLFDYGLTPPIDPEANPQVRSMAEAIRTKKFPERLSVLGIPKPFDAKAYAKNPQDYLDVVEPGRIFQTARPGKGVPRLRKASPYYRQVIQGETITLRVGAPAGSPVSFTSFDLGQFENQLTAITVQANKEGVAEVRFTATPGAIEDVNIMAGCPQASGQVRFVVNIQKGNAG